MGKNEILPKRLEILRVNDSACRFRINVDVLNEAFGIGRSMLVSATYPDKKDTWISAINSEDKFVIWMPKLYGNKSGWKNWISDEGKIIYEVADPSKAHDWMETDEGQQLVKAKRIVFVKDKASSPYRFVGVFENNEMNHLKHSYRRIASEIRLIGNPVYSIELKDNQ